MSRSGYDNDDADDGYWPWIKYRGQVASAIRGRRGQAFLRDLIAALDALPERQLIAHDLHSTCGVCALGSVGVHRRMDMSALDPENPEQIANAFGIAHQLVREIEYENDEAGLPSESPEARWRRMRDWAERHTKEAAN